MIMPFYFVPIINILKSVIFKQSLDNNVSLLSWEHLSFLIKNNIKESMDINLSSIWNFPFIQGKITMISDSENNYFEAQNSYIANQTKLSENLLNAFLYQSKKETIDRCDEEKNYWENKKNEIQQYTKEYAIDCLIKSLKINQKIEQIDKYQKDLRK